MTTAQMTLDRPQFAVDDISTIAQWMLEEIEDLNADALDAICSECSARLSWGQWINGNDYKLLSQTQCHSCGEPIRFLESSWSLPTHQRDAVEVPGFFDRRWYHATMRSNWAETAKEAVDGRLIAHAGSRLSALSRADSFIQSHRPGPISLYSFELTSTADFTTTIYDDMGEDWPERTDEQYAMRICHQEDQDDDLPSQWEHLAEGITGAPYYNRYEVPGQISILFHAKLIDLSTVEVVELDQENLRIANR